MSRCLHPDDIVAKKADLKQLAVVDRTHEDIETHQPFPGRIETEPIRHDRSISHAAFQRFMRDGIPPIDTVLVRWQLEACMELLPASRVVLVDRSLLVGDVVKRSTPDAMSGIVLNTFTRCILQPMCDVTYRGSARLKGLLPPGMWKPSDQFFIHPTDQPPLIDVPASELQYAEAPSDDDLVIYKDWIGRVEAVKNKLHIKLLDDCVVEVDDEVGEHADGSVGQFVVGDILRSKKGQLRTGVWIFGRYNPNTPPVGTVVSVRTVGVEITWLQKRIGSTDQHEPPFVLESAELESEHFRIYDRTQRPAARRPVINTTSNSEIDVRLNLRVRFKDLTGACLKYNTSEEPNWIPRLDRTEHLGYDLNVFDVMSFRTEVTVQWQDLSITSESSIDLVPDASIDDEHAVWPGEIAHTLALRPTMGMDDVFNPERVGVVQSVNAAERMACIRWSTPSSIKYWKIPGQKSDLPPILEYMITPLRDGSQLEEEISLYDIEAPAAINVRRGDIVLLTPPAASNWPTQRPGDVTWLGEIVDTLLNGMLVIRLGASTEVRDIVLERHEAVVAVRSDGTGELDDWDEDEMDQDLEDDSGSDYDDEYDENDLDGGEILDTEAITAHYEDENGDILGESDVENDDWESADEDNMNEDIEMRDAQEEQTPLTSLSVTPTNGIELEVMAPDQKHDAVVTSIVGAPAPYAILDGDVVSDHHYRNEPTSTNVTRLKRVQKEHKILRSPDALPHGVYIRAWETRLDLLRVLLVGPTETPYENAPFVVDFFLPATFPAEPPQAFFHSWPAHANIGAIGRVNPNLYEDGKICLSLLGTWDGNKTEGWSAGRSTLLQVIVSLLGLVLVREPYFNEAGYEALVGTEASRRPSALYSERICLRSKGFLITAVTSLDEASGLKGLQDIIKWLYLTDDGPHLLQQTIRTVEEVLQRSDAKDVEPNGLTIVSRGACVSLRRALSKLQDLRAALT